MSDTHVKGLAELQQFLDQLAPKIERNVLRGSLRAGMKGAILPAAKEQLASNGSIKSGKLQAGLKARLASKHGLDTSDVEIEAS